MFLIYKNVIFFIEIFSSFKRFKSKCLIFILVNNQQHGYYKYFRIVKNAVFSIEMFNNFRKLSHFG